MDRDQARDQGQGQAQARDQYYLRRLSQSLGRRLATPVQRVDGPGIQPPVPGGPVPAPQQAFINAAPAPAVAPATGPHAADANNLQQQQQQAYGQQRPGVVPGVAHQVVDIRMPPGMAGPDVTHQTPATTNSPWRQLPPLKGTLRGKYTGRASEQWLVEQMQKEINDLARATDTFAVVREGKIHEAQRQTLQAEAEMLRAQQADLRARIAELELMLPNDNGEFKGLRQELQELEKEADQYYNNYQRELQTRAAAEAALAEARARLTVLEAELATLRGPGAGAPKVGPAAAIAAGSGADEVVLNMLAFDQANPGKITPEVVLAAAAFLRDKGELPPSMTVGRWPDKRAVALRLVLVLLFLALIAGTVLLTHYLTLKYDD